MSAVQMLAPSVPLLFMGEEWGAVEPFYFFTDFEGELANAVREGRRNEFSRFADFADPTARERIPDPQAESTYRRSILDWTKRRERSHRDTLDYYRGLLDLRRTEIMPRLGRVLPHAGVGTATESGLLTVHWTLSDGSRLHLAAHLSAAAGYEAAPDIAGRLLWATSPAVARRNPLRDLPPWFVGFFLEGM
jgi:1,4-alpha-glucan branching enzyme